MKKKMFVLVAAALCVVAGLAEGFFGYHPFHDDYYYDAPYQDPYYAPAYYGPDADVAAGRAAAAREQRTEERIVYPKALQKGRTE